MSVVRPIPHADQTIHVGESPYNVATGFRSVWVTIFGRLVRLDPATGAIVARISVGGRPWGVAIGEEAVWVGNQFDGTVARVDPATDTVAWRVRLNTPLGKRARSAWRQAAARSGRPTGRPSRSGDSTQRQGRFSAPRIGDAHEFVGFGEGGVWVSSEDGTVGELDPASGTLTRSIAAGADADFLGFSPGSVWVTNYRSVFFWRIDPAMSSRRPSSPRGSPRLAQASNRNGRRGARRGGNGVRLATREEP